MKRIVLLITVVALTMAIAVGAYPGKRRGSKLASTVAAPPPPPGVTPPCTEDEGSIDECPITGCGELGDGRLNTAKNQTSAPSSPVAMTLDEIRALHQPLHWNTGANRSSIQGAGKEGTGVVVKGFLLKVKAEGKESCNCGLGRRIDTDVHLAVVSKLPDSETETAIDNSELTSITAEITPRVRGENEKWLFKNVNDLEGFYVRLTGLLMLDTKHIPQSHLLPHERTNHGLKRATNWEIHPVTKIEICTKSKKTCDNGTGWKNYE
jgi:hypothetical protein